MVHVSRSSKVDPNVPIGLVHTDHAGRGESFAVSLTPPPRLLRLGSGSCGATPRQGLAAAASELVGESSGGAPAVAAAAAGSTAAARVFVGTWNLHGKDPPRDLRPWLQAGTDTGAPQYDMYAIGTQEACRSIEMSLLLPSKAKWEAKLREALGGEYVCVASHTLAAIHLALFVRRGLLPSISHVRTAHVATGIGNALGNKGGVGVSLSLGQTTMLFVNSHLAAHTSAVAQRNADYRRIDTQLGLRPPPWRGDPQGGEGPSCSAAFDVCVWLGDLNYRVCGNRKIIDSLLQPPSEMDCRSSHWEGAGAHWDSMRAVLLANDQLTQERAAGRAFHGFQEAPIAFRPTYKYDVESDRYDTSEKCRVPAYTDRVLWREMQPGSVRVERYDSCAEMRTSDHRAVLADLTVTYAMGDSRLSGNKGPKRRALASSAGGGYSVSERESAFCALM
jgi:hypothetical protein